MPAPRKDDQETLDPWRKAFVKVRATVHPNELIDSGGDGMTAAWVVRTGKNGERDGWSLETGLAGGGWDEVPDLRSCTTRDDVRKVVTDTYGGLMVLGALNNYTAQLWALRSRIAPCDIIVLPLKTTNQIAIGRATSGYCYLSDSTDVSQRHCVPVKWERQDIPRTAIHQDLLYTLGAFSTIFQATRHDAINRLNSLNKTGRDPGFSAPAL